MNFDFSDAQKMIRQTAQEFTERYVAPLAAELDQTGEFPRETFGRMAAHGFTGIGIPEEYGGSGGSDIEKVIVVSELAKKCGATAATLSIHMIFPAVILKFGSEEQRKNTCRPWPTVEKSVPLP
jgi:Acyl-CoA dehydrogenases